jgi:hypothetical protein
MTIPRPTILVALLFIAAASPGEAQSAVGLVNLASRRAADLERAAELVRLKSADSTEPIRRTSRAPVTAVRHPYVGAQLGYAFSDGDFASNAVTTGTIMYPVIGADPNGDGSKSGRFYLPVVGNFGNLAGSESDEDKKKLANLVGSPGGLRIALEPYLVLSDESDPLQFSVFAHAGWALRTSKDANDTLRYLPQGRYAAGVSFSLGPRDGETRPVVAELSWVGTSFANREYRKVLGANADASNSAFLATIIVPTSTTSGFLTEVVATRGSLPTWRLGLVLISSSK